MSSGDNPSVVELRSNLTTFATWRKNHLRGDEKAVQLVLEQAELFAREGDA